jgi:hypothetical protein
MRIIQSTEDMGSFSMGAVVESASAYFAQSVPKTKIISSWDSREQGASTHSPKGYRRGGRTDLGDRKQEPSPPTPNPISRAVRAEVKTQQGYSPSSRWGTKVRDPPAITPTGREGIAGQVPIQSPSTGTQGKERGESHKGIGMGNKEQRRTEAAGATPQQLQPPPTTPAAAQKKLVFPTPSPEPQPINRSHGQQMLSPLIQEKRKQWITKVQDSEPTIPPVELARAAADAAQSVQLRGSTVAKTLLGEARPPEAPAKPWSKEADIKEVLQQEPTATPSPTYPGLISGSVATVMIPWMLVTMTPPNQQLIERMQQLAPTEEDYADMFQCSLAVMDTHGYLKTSCKG